MRYLHTHCDVHVVGLLLTVPEGLGHHVGDVSFLECHDANVGWREKIIDGESYTRV